MKFWDNVPLPPQTWDCRHGFYLFIYFETGSHCLALAVLELPIYTSLTLNSQGSTCLYLPELGLKMSTNTMPAYSHFFSMTSQVAQTDFTLAV